MSNNFFAAITLCSVWYRMPRQCMKQDSFNYFASYSDVFYIIPRHSIQQQILTLPITYIFRLDILCADVT